MKPVIPATAAAAWRKTAHLCIIHRVLSEIIASYAWSLPGFLPPLDGGPYRWKSKLRVLMPGIGAEIKDNVVLDFGCGTGVEAVEMEQIEAKRVIGLYLPRSCSCCLGAGREGWIRCPVRILQLRNESL